MKTINYVMFLAALNAFKAEALNAEEMHEFLTIDFAYAHYTNGAGEECFSVSRRYDNWTEENLWLIKIEPGKHFPKIILCRWENNQSITSEKEVELWNDIPAEFIPFVERFAPSVKVSWNKEVIDVIDEIYIPTSGMFIIPNHAGKAAGYIMMNKDKLIADMTAIAEANGCAYDSEHDPLVQLWMCSDSFGFVFDNLQDHSPHVKDNDGNYYYLRFPYHLPIEVCRKFKEGETKELILPNIFVSKAGKDYRLIDTYNQHKLTCKIIMKVTPSQTLYRYRSFGTWEETTEYVI